MIDRTLRKSLSLIVLSAAVLGTAVHAQAQVQPVPPEHYTLDERGVDLVSGRFNYSEILVAIGPTGGGGLTHGRTWTGGWWRDLTAGTLNAQGTVYSVSLGPHTEVFTRSGNVFTPRSNSGATLVAIPGGYTFTTSDGIVATFSSDLADDVHVYAANAGLLTALVMPNGDRVSYNYFTQEYCAEYSPGVTDCIRYESVTRLESITNGRGYQIKYFFLADELTETNVQQFMTAKSATGINNAVDYCDPFAPTPCTLTRNWPSVTYDNPFLPTQATDQSGRTTTYLYGTGGLVGVRRAGQSGDQFAVSNDAGGRVTQITDGTGTWSYTYSDEGSTRTTVSTGPENQRLIVVSNLAIGRATSVVEAVDADTSRVTGYQYDGQRRLTRITQPEGNYTQIAYDMRGNVTQTTQVAKSGSNLPDIVSSASYPSPCTNVRTCNQPTSTTDPRGNATDYAYDPAHGGLLTVTEPAPAVGAPRPQTRVSYDSQTAWYKDASGSIVASASPIILPIAVGACVSGDVASGCASTANEIVSTIAYGSAGTGNNLLPTQTTIRAGDNSISATTTLTYTSNGDVETVDGPLTSQSDITRYVYDDARQLTGMIGPDPDGAGLLRNRAMRTAYNPDGTVSLSEFGTTAGQGPSDMATFNALQQTSLVHDQYLRPTQSSFTAAGTVYAMNQVFYDASGRPFCQVQRMNPATFLNPPSCAPTQGPFGPDRISVTTYDLASQPLNVTSGFGTSAALNQGATWTLNGLPATLSDGRSNVSAITYDGFDRLSRINYPDPATRQPSATDYEAVTYDAASNVLTSRTRSDQTFTSAYDQLNRTTMVTAPAPIAGQAPTDSVIYTYDNIGRALSATIPGIPPVTTAMTWDALGRQVTEAGPLGTMAMQHDPAGRRTRLTWPDGFYVNYGYDPTGAMISITQGASSNPISAYAYDDLGRRIYQTRANGVNTTYGYDPASRLTSLIHDPAGTSADQTYGYSHNAAGQIVNLSSTNSAYEYTGLAAGWTQYEIDGLNRTAAVNGTELVYDVNGNLTGDGLRVFAYDAANRLRSTNTNNGTIRYDALGRLREVSGTLGARYLSDGIEAAAIYPPGDSTTVQERFVRGPWPDELVGTYQGSDASVLNYQLHDHQGSAVAIVGPMGAIVGAPLAYDDYGQPQVGNGGRFMYTGQLWLPDFGLYHYKARAYHPGLGRFMQTDPIRYTAGMNFYGYVGGDPINFIDPLGLCPDAGNPACDEADLGEIPAIGSRCSSRAAFCLPGGVNVGLPEDLVRTNAYTGGGGGVAAEICRIGSTQVEKRGNRLSIRGNVAFPNGESNYLSSINSAWTGQFGRYNVSSRLSVGSGGLIANIAFGPGGQPTGDIGGPNLNLNTLIGANPGQASYSRWAAGHEFGHSLGLLDRYSATTGIAQSGYDREIMGAYQGTPNEGTIDNVLQNCG